MLFNSLAFAIFLPIVFIIYWALPHRFRWFILLVSSYYFYMSWNAKYIVLIFFTTLVTYLAGILLEKTTNDKSRKGIVVVSTTLCLLVLFFFKYFNFLSNSVFDFLSLFAIKLNPIILKVALPVGISFYTFQTLSYVIDIYRGKINAEHHFGYYAAFISFFPQLVAGPIERTENLLPQIRKEQHFEYNQATYGLKLMAWGFFKKLAIADVLGTYVDTVYGNLHSYNGFAVVIAIFFFTIQIYCDFSGYSDIAIGTAKLLGINLMTNFKSPYFSTSIKEFWSRWHISLSTWFRDYVYIPMGGNRVSKKRHAVNLMTTFLLSGLWHGASWTYVLWGGIHGLIQCIENVITKGKKIKYTGIKWWSRVFLTFLIASIAWVFFRAESMTDALYVFTHMTSEYINPISYAFHGCVDVGMGISGLLKIIFAMLVLAIFDYASLKTDVIDWVSARPLLLRYVIYLCLVFCIISFSYAGGAEFVYFQF